MKAIGEWNAAWDSFYELAPAWTDEFMATAAGMYASGILPAKEIDLLRIALCCEMKLMEDQVAYLRALPQRFSQVLRSG